jgi:hypothetical protein
MGSAMSDVDGKFEGRQNEEKYLEMSHIKTGTSPHLGKDFW